MFSLFAVTMVRKYERKTARANTPPDIMLKAVRAVKLNNLSIRQVAEKFGINYRTLTRYCKKIPEEELLCENITTPTISVGYVKVRQTFTNSQEQELINYIRHASDIYIGLSTKEVKILAYNLAQYNSIKMPASWIKNKMAGDDWLNALMKRHSDLPIRKAETISKTREISFNRTNVELFYKNLEKVMSCYHFQPEDIWNMDEIGITTLQITDRIVARRDKKQVENNISAARGNLVTMACTISAKGDHMPPFFVFPRVYFRDYFIASAPAGTSGTANRLGWMEEKDFEKFLRHFHAHSKCSIEKPVLLLLDQRSLHLSIESLNYTKGNGIVMLSFPQYCSHKLQPLDRTIFELLKEHVNSASNAWVLNNPNHTMNIYNIPEVIAVAYPFVMTPTNIQAGFKCTGIFPYNNDVFSDLDFESNFITDESHLEKNLVVK